MLKLIFMSALILNQSNILLSDNISEHIAVEKMDRVLFDGVGLNETCSVYRLSDEIRRKIDKHINGLSVTHIGWFEVSSSTKPSAKNAFDIYQSTSFGASLGADGMLSLKSGRMGRGGNEKIYVPLFLTINANISKVSCESLTVS